MADEPTSPGGAAATEPPSSAPTEPTTPVGSSESNGSSGSGRDRWDRLGIGPIDEWLPTVKVTLASIVLALLIGAVLIIVSTPDVISALSYFFSYPADTFTNAAHAVGSSYWALLTGSVGSWTAITNTLSQAAPLICAGLGVTLAFRAGLFNIGAQGQLIIGAAFAGYVGFHFHLPVVIHLVAAVVPGWSAARCGAASPASSRRRPVLTRSS